MDEGASKVCLGHWHEGQQQQEARGQSLTHKCHAPSVWVLRLPSPNVLLVARGRLFRKKGFWRRGGEGGAKATTNDQAWLRGSWGVQFLILCLGPV